LIRWRVDLQCRSDIGIGVAGTSLLSHDPAVDDLAIGRTRRVSANTARYAISWASLF
jgi:hypothetical protein